MWFARVGGEINDVLESDCVMARRSRKRWIQSAIQKPGALHRQLGIPMGEIIPLPLLHHAARAPGVLGQRARMALTLRKMATNRKRRLGKARRKRR